MSIITLDHMRALVEKGLVREKEDEDGFITFKYHNKVFYKNLWHLDEALLEARGIVFSPKGQIVQRPFKKIFNRGENGTDFEEPEGDQKKYVAARKVNGFMAAASFHNGRFIVSTTGTTNSEYANLAFEMLWDRRLPLLRFFDFTFIFEVCHRDDPHIVPEEEGVYLLGMRHKELGYLVNPLLVNGYARENGFLTPEMKTMSASEILDEASKCDHEGFVVYDKSEPVLKLKSPHYLSKKALMRMGKKNVNTMFDDPDFFKSRLDEEFYELFDHILSDQSKESWHSMTEGDRRGYIEEYFSD